MTSPPLVVRFGSLGDMVQLSVLMERLGKETGRPVDLLAGTPGARDLLARLPEVGEIWIARGRRTPYLLAPEQWELVRWLRHRGPSPVCLIETVESARAPLLRLLRRGGMSSAEVFDASALERGALEHTLDFLDRVSTAFLDRLGPARGSESDPARSPCLPPTVAESADFLAWRDRLGLGSRPLVVFHVTSRRANRGRWPTARWAELARAILEKLPDAAILLSGTAADRPGIAALARACSDPRVIDTSGDLPLGRLLALLAVADSCVSLDSGPAHLAAAVGCPLVVLLGMADPRRVAPRGSTPIELVAARPSEAWPADPLTWQRMNALADIPLGSVLGAWIRVRSADSPHGNSPP